MTPIQQQLLEAYREIEITKASIQHTHEVEDRLEEEVKALNEMERRLPKEQRDVDILEREGLTGLVLNIVGGREEKIEKQREEYDLLASRHIELFKSVKLLRFELEILKKKNTTLEQLEMKAATLLKKRETELRIADPKLNETFKDLNQHLTDLANQRNRIRKATDTGEKVVTSFVEIEESLEKALDNINNSESGSGALAHEAAKGAQYNFRKSKTTLIRFQKEMEDIFEIPPVDTNIKFEDFSEYSGVVFQGFGLNLFFIQKVNSTLGRVREKRKDIEIVVNILDQHLEKTSDQIEELESRKRELILNT
ncbi:MAG: hypothetical protein ABI761_07850 [Saprospiraceae bacterium]